MRRFACLLLCLPVWAGCSTNTPPADEGDPNPPPVNVAGLFDYDGFAPPLPFALRGTITFEQVGDLVRVVNVTYANANDRPLVGEATLNGRQLDIVLVPENGQTDFRADVTFIFSEDGNSFEVAFSDTNGDMGDLGDYVGTRRAP
ncbi:MAG: hypothetical protein OER88_03635 [Planctomycetota bacterium]|nr:hypothetical protein [Planctomycetota bacterium]